jgi:seryl-tRNA synthetase
MSAPFRTTEGFATLGPELVRVRELLEARFTGWAAQIGADHMLFPPLLPVDALQAFDYFENFPHLLLLAAPIDAERQQQARVHGGEVSSSLLAPSRLGLASAACYNVYLHLRDSELGAARYITTVATCYRNEDHYDGLRRLHAFSMREIVCVGTADEARDHIAAFKPKVLEFARQVGLELAVQIAGDPFFQNEGPRAVLQKLFPVKEEFVHDGSLAIASVNFHRNFFGERCGIRLADGTYASSACVAFGLERWLAALLDVHGDAKAVLNVLEEAAQ